MDAGFGRRSGLRASAAGRWKKSPMQWAAPGAPEGCRRGGRGDEGCGPGCHGCHGSWLSRRWVAPDAAWHVNDGSVVQMPSTSFACGVFLACALGAFTDHRGPPTGATKVNRATAGWVCAHLGLAARRRRRRSSSGRVVKLEGRPPAKAWRALWGVSPCANAALEPWSPGWMGTGVRGALKHSRMDGTALVVVSLVVLTSC